MFEVSERDRAIKRRIPLQSETMNIASLINILCRLRLPLLATVIVALPSLAQTDGQPPFQNPDLAIEERVDDLISKLTIEEKIGQTMMASPEITRLGIPKYDWWNEALHGVARNGIATVFPQAIALAATWNPELHEQIAEAISTEARAKNNETIRKSGGDTRRYEGLTIWSP